MSSFLPDIMTEKTPDGEEINPAAEQGMPVEPAKDVYTEEGLEEQQDNDAISPREEAFMEGARSHGQLGHCATCSGQLDTDPKNVVEKEIKRRDIREGLQGPGAGNADAHDRDRKEEIPLIRRPPPRKLKVGVEQIGPEPVAAI